MQLVRVLCVFGLHQNGLVKTPAVECMRASPRKLFQQWHRVCGMSGHGFQGNTLSSILLHTKGRLQTPVDEYVQTLPLVVAPARQRNETRACKMWWLCGPLV